MRDDHHDPSLADDLRLLTTRAAERRRFMGLFAVAGLALAGCGDDGDAADPSGSTASGTGGGGGGSGGAGGAGGAGSTASTASTTGTTGTTASTSTGSSDCEAIPEETAGPFPGDGTNGPNALTTAGIVRSDMRTSFGGASGVATGVVLTVELTLVDASGCAPLAGHAVYLWHCDAVGNYSMYSPAAVNENYLRAVQASDADGKVTFTTIFPGAYPGRWPHMHFEVYPSLEAATDAANRLATSQLALPEESCDEVFATTGYASSANNFATMSLATDGVFSDGAEAQLATVSGTVADGLAATLTVAV